MPFFLVEADKADDQGRDGQGEQEACRMSPEGSPDDGLIEEEVTRHDDGNHQGTQIGVLQEMQNVKVELGAEQDELDDPIQEIGNDEAGQDRVCWRSAFEEGVTCGKAQDV